MKEKNLKPREGKRIPVKVMGKEIPVKARGEGGNGVFIKTALKVFIVLLVIGQMLLLSAFEAHIVNVTAKICRPSEVRTMGYWKNHLDLFTECLAEGIRIEDRIITTQEQAEIIFNAANASTMENMLRAQLLVMKLNIQCTGIEANDGEIYKDYLGNDITLAVLLDRANQALLNSAPRHEMEYYMILLDNLNNEGYIKYCASSWFVGFDNLKNSEKDKDKDKETPPGLLAQENEKPGKPEKENKKDNEPTVLGDVTIENPSIGNSSSTPPTTEETPPQEETEEEQELPSVETGNASPSPESL